MAGLPFCVAHVFGLQSFGEIGVPEKLKKHLELLNYSAC
jgi:hypothetical protein